jgi:hypothetical protein
MAQHAHYWSCSKFGDWLRGTPKLDAGTSEEWNAWNKLARKAHPYRYWMAEEALGKIQDGVTWPTRSLYGIKYYLVNRYVTKTHALTSTLKRGQWHDVSERMLHAPFDELVDFVEIETAWMHIAWADEEDKAKYKAPWNATGPFRLRTWRCPEAGIDHLKWSASLVMDEDMGVDKDSENYGKLTSQATGAQEILDLYYWWKHARATRPDPYEASGWSAHCAARRIDEEDDGIFTSDRTPEQKAESRRCMDELGRLEAEYEAEDEAMLIRLMKVLRSLWT